MKLTRSIVLASVMLAFCLQWPAAWCDPVPVVPPPLSAKDHAEMLAEQKMGSDAATAIAKQLKLSTDTTLTDRVNRIGQRIAAVANTYQIPALFGNNRIYPFTWTFHVVEDKDINAFSLPGGFVYVNTGLLALVASDDELAGVLGHEITHAAHHHVALLVRQNSKINMGMEIGIIAAALAHVDPQTIGSLAVTANAAGTAVMNNIFSEDAERDADHGGLLYMQKAGFNPIGMLTFMDKLEDLEHRSVDLSEATIFQDHPFTDDRVIAIRQELSGLGITPTAKEMDAVSDKVVHFTVVSVDANTRSITLDKTACATIYDPNGTRSSALLNDLNNCMDAGLTLSAVSSANGVVSLNNRPWLTVSAADLATKPGSTIDSMAADIAHALQTILYRESFLSSDPSDAVGSGKI